MRSLITVIFITGLVGCNNNPPSSSLIYQSEYSEGTEISLNYQLIKIPIDTLCMIYYQKKAVFESKGFSFLYGYNESYHGIDVFDITNTRLISHIPLSSEGRNSILKVYSLEVVSQDSIYILDRLSLKLINSSGELLSSYKLYFDMIEDDRSGYIISFNRADFKIDKFRNKLFGYFVDEKIRGEQRRAEGLRKPIVGSFDLVSNTISFLPIFYSDYIIENNGDFANEITPNLSYQGDKIIYGFPVESNIYIYDCVNGETEIIGATSRYSKNFSPQYHLVPNYDFRLEGTWFNDVNYYSAGQLYYRTHWGDQSRESSLDPEISAFTKPGYIMFFDENFKVIGEELISYDHWLEDEFYTNEGIYFWSKHTVQVSEDTLVLGRYRPSIVRKAQF